MRLRLVIFLANILVCLHATAQLNIDNVVMLGRELLGKEEFAKAVTRFDEVLTVRPRMADVYYYRAYAHFSLGRYEQAEADCSEAIRLNPFREEYNSLRGLCRINMKNYSGAIADYTRVLRDNATDATIRYNRALCLLEQKNYEEAISDVDMLLRQPGQNGRAYLLRSQIQLEQGDTLQAMHWVDTLLCISPFDRDALAFRGRLAIWQADYLLADSLLSQAIMRGGIMADNYISRAQARHELRRYDQAIEDYNEAIALSPRHFVGHYNRGLLLAHVGADNLALQDFDFVLQVDSLNTLALYNRALLRERTGNYSGAEDDITQILLDYPNFFNGYALRARCRREMGQEALAKADETIAHRKALDNLFASIPKRKDSIRHVRRLSAQDISRYQELLENDTLHIAE